MKADFTLKGGHVLAIMLAAFAAVVAANAVFITLAVRTFPGEQEKKSYVQGLSYNARLAEREAQEKLGWTAEVSRFRRAAGEVEVELRFRSGEETPISGLVVGGMLARPAAAESHALAFHETAPGLYSAAAGNIGQGAWRLEAAATGANSELFRLQKKLTLP